jgi:hypothetical protein
VAVLLAMTIGASAGAQATPPPASQNPSPMVETTRAHERLSPGAHGGSHAAFDGPGGRSVDVWIPAATAGEVLDVVVHFHGAAWLPKQAVAALPRPHVAAVVNLGAGSGVYDRTYAVDAAFDALLRGIADAIAHVHPRARVGRVTLAGFSAGHGAIRAILREPRHFDRVDAVLLLDGMHTSYVPERTVLALGGTLDTTNLVALTRFADAATRGAKRMLVTHSEIFPGSFASTTETADYMLGALGLRRTPVLKWGPRGMQQLGEVASGNFLLRGFAGNTAPDHIDHLHGMPELLAMLLQLGGGN